MNENKKDSLNPSPYFKEFVRSSLKHTGPGKGASLNDSLDKLKFEFMQGYQEVMQESDAAMRKEALLTAEKNMDNLGAMISVGNRHKG